MTMLLCVRKRTHVIHQTPNVIRCLHLAEGWHSCVSDSVLDNPKQLLIGIALNFLTREVRCAWVHPPSRWGLGAAVNSVACAAIQAVMCSSGFAAGFYVYWSWRYSLAARTANGKVLGPIRNARFKRAGFLQRRQPELHHSNPDQHHTRRNYCPNDSRPHQVSLPRQVTSRGVHSSFLQLRGRAREYELVKEVGRSGGQVGSSGPH